MNPPQDDALETAKLKRENEILSQQVKRLIRAEGKLYEYQEKLDAQLKEYQELYDLSRKLHATVNIGNILKYAVEYAIHKLEYERVLIFQQVEGADDFTVCALDGYYKQEEKEHVMGVTIKRNDALLSALRDGKEYLICRACDENKRLAGWQDKLLMNEYVIYPLVSATWPFGFLAAGNSLENAGFYRRVNDDEGALLGVGNLVELLSSSIENYIYHTQMERALKQQMVAEEKYRKLSEELEQRVTARTSELEAANSELTLLARQLEVAYNELKAAQSRILQQEKMASIGQLAAGVAHEINNPVGFIMSNLKSLQKYSAKRSEFIRIQAEALKELSTGDDNAVLRSVRDHQKAMKLDYITEDIDNLISESLDGAERVKNIVQDLKGFSRVDEAELKMTDINAGLESTINIVWNELKYKATVKKDYGNIPLINCNPGQLNQVFMNMLINAAHSIEQHGEIAVRTWREGAYLKVSIADTGCGIPEDKLGRIFEPFFTTKDVGKGTGLGLSIAYDIIKKHDGEILVESEVGKGTTFTIVIPITEDSE
ncbi:MAG: hypothetical protein EPN22_13790 [Nitrospirae bacterium]|nr:MAG: hypothetical protein EPN22_13790 [Nitrospirota bacterium]